MSFPPHTNRSTVPHSAADSFCPSRGLCDRATLSPRSLLALVFLTHVCMMLTRLLCYLEGLVLYMDFSELLLAVQSPQELYKFQLRYHLFWNIYIVCSPISFKSLLRCPIYNKKRPCATLSLLIPLTRLDFI